jgi:hypothetical protein
VQPHDFEVPPFNIDVLTLPIFPQSQRQFHKQQFGLLSAKLITVHRPNRLPVKSLKL